MALGFPPIVRDRYEQMIGPDDYSLKIDNVQLSDEDDFECQITPHGMRSQVSILQMDSSAHLWSRTASSKYLNIDGVITVGTYCIPTESRSYCLSDPLGWAYLSQLIIFTHTETFTLSHTHTQLA